VLPLCFAGWLGWQALAEDGSGQRPAPAGIAASPRAAAPPAQSSPTTQNAPGTMASSHSPSASPSAPASRSAAATAAAGRPLAGRTVLLDPGHNPGNAAHTAEINRKVDIGNARKECDTTGTETNAGYTEASFTLDVVRRARALLRAEGATVVLTQNGDRPWGPCIDQRAAIGNRAHADAAVSVHGDGAPAAGHGFHVILPARVVAGRADTAPIVGPSRTLGLLLKARFAAATGEPVADYIGKGGIDVRGDLGGLNLSTVPKVFIECGNMRNAGDARRMTDPAWRQRAARGIADAITAYLTRAGH
jgi:N-acetylmuramoyl-L-alanine amidase